MSGPGGVSSGLVAWYAADSAFMKSEYSHNDEVEEWDDLSGNDYHAAISLSPDVSLRYRDTTHSYLEVEWKWPQTVESFPSINDSTHIDHVTFVTGIDIHTEDYTYYWVGSLPHAKPNLLYGIQKLLWSPLAVIFEGYQHYRGRGDAEIHRTRMTTKGIGLTQDHDDKGYLLKNLSIASTELHFFTNEFGDRIAWQIRKMAPDGSMETLSASASFFTQGSQPLVNDFALYRYLQNPTKSSAFNPAPPSEMEPVDEYEFTEDMFFGSHRIYEYIIFDRILTAQEKEDVEEYLYEKYAAEYDLTGNDIEILPTVGTPTAVVTKSHYYHPQVLDHGLERLREATRFDLCTQMPTSYAEATSTYSLGNKTGYQGGDIVDTDIGRKVEFPLILDGLATGTGYVSHWALSDTNTSTLLAAGPLHQGFTIGSSFVVPAFGLALPKASS